jgi:Mycothiol maleylpyruvate isomerase N-terminal domain
MTSPNAGGLDYLGHLARESARFAEAVGTVPPSAAVPTCPDWNADDLLWHLGEVQWFWGAIVRDGVTTDDQVEKLRAERPGS